MDNVYYNKGIIDGWLYEQYSTTINLMHKQHNHNINSYSAD